MMGPSIIWTDKVTDDDQLVRASLYMMWMNDAEYDGDESKYVLLGSAFKKQDNDKFGALVAYSMAPGTTTSRYYGDQSDTRKLDKEFDCIEDAQTTVEEFSASFFERLGAIITEARK